MTAEERARHFWASVADVSTRTVVEWIEYRKLLEPAFEAHARAAVEAEQKARERLEEACRDAMTAMRDITMDDLEEGGATYTYFDGEIAACEAALRKVDR